MRRALGDADPDTDAQDAALTEFLLEEQSGHLATNTPSLATAAQPTATSLASSCYSSAINEGKTRTAHSVVRGSPWRNAKCMDHAIFCIGSIPGKGRLVHLFCNIFRALQFFPKTGRHSFCFNLENCVKGSFLNTTKPEWHTKCCLTTPKRGTLCTMRAQHFFARMKSPGLNSKLRFFAGATTLPSTVSAAASATQPDTRNHKQVSCCCCCCC